MKNKDENNLLDDEKLYNFLNKITACIFAYSITNPGVNSLRTPVYSEMIKIIEEKEITFEDYKFDKNSLIASINNYGLWILESKTFNQINANVVGIY